MQYFLSKYQVSTNPLISKVKKTTSRQQKEKAVRTVPNEAYLDKQEIMGGGNLSSYFRSRTANLLLHLLLQAVVGGDLFCVSTEA